MVTLLRSGDRTPRYFSRSGTVTSVNRRARGLSSVEGSVLSRCAAPFGREMWFGWEDMP